MGLVSCDDVIARAPGFRGRSKGTTEERQRNGYGETSGVRTKNDNSSGLEGEGTQIFGKAVSPCKRASRVPRGLVVNPII